MTLKEAIAHATASFKDTGSPTPRWDGEFILTAITNKNTSYLYTYPEAELSKIEESIFYEYCSRRAKGEPIAYILGKKDFYKSIFIVDKNVLIPRPETEQIVEGSLNWLKDRYAKGKESFGEPLKIVEFGVGSGAIGLSIVKDIINSKWGSGCPIVRLAAVDVSGAALCVAKENASALGLSKYVDFILADLNGESVDKIGTIGKWVSSVDLVVMNPPYISSSDDTVDINVDKYEPAIALYATENGFHSIGTWIKSAAKLLKIGGRLITEIGHEQGAMTREAFIKNDFKDVVLEKDLAGLDRMVTGIKKL